MGTLRTERYPDDHEVVYAAEYRDVPDLAKHPILLDRRKTRAIKSGSAFEVICASGAIVAAVIGLAGVAPVLLAAAATIAVGFALLAQGGTLAARWQDAVRIPGSERSEAVGIGTEVFGGLAGIALGTLALVGMSPLVLLPVSAIVLGIALLLGGPTQPELANVAARGGKHYRVTRRGVRSSGSIMVMAGLGALVLGSLALLASTGPIVTLSLAAMLCVAIALVLAGGAVFARFASRFA